MTTKKKIVSSKSTGGGGYDFEDKVAAYFLLCLLSEEPPLKPENGIITKVSFQNRVDGWLLDDILLEISKDEKVSHCAISVKSSSQFTTKGAPIDFVTTIWQQHLEQDPKVFDLTSDFLAIATTALPSTGHLRMNKLLEKVHTNQTGIDSRINMPGFASQIERNI